MTIRRLKTYTGSQGYVYQYYFVGQRPTPGGEATEYIFDVTSDRKLTYSVTVNLARRILAAWTNAHGRVLSDSEQYAAVKLRLFRAFDEIEHMQSDGRSLEIEFAGLEQSLASLGVE